MKVLITGGNGYVGRTLTRLLYRDHQVTVFDNMRSGRNRFTPEERSLFQLVEGDICDFPAVQSVFGQVSPDVTIHLAAIHYIPECESYPDEAVRINTIGAMNVLRACNPGTRFVLASTAAVYGAEDKPHEEASSPIAPLDVYGLSKLHAEAYVRYWAAQSKLDARIVRLFNVVGPGETNPHVLPAILAQTLRGVRKLRLGNCSPKRDYIDVRDAADGFAAVALGSARGPGVDVVNVGTGQSYSVTELVEKLGHVVGEPLEIEVDPMRLRPVDRPFVAASTLKATRDYRWSARRSIETSLRDLWRDADIPAELLARS